MISCSFKGSQVGPTRSAYGNRLHSRKRPTPPKLGVSKAHGNMILYHDPKSTSLPITISVVIMIAILAAVTVIVRIVTVRVVVMARVMVIVI